jgi:hypothetical protein
MFIENECKMSRIPKGLYVKVSFLHTIPSGFRNTALLFFYKHIFPSGIGDIIYRNCRLKDASKNLEPNLLIFNELQPNAGLKPALGSALRLLTDNYVIY